MRVLLRVEMIEVILRYDEGAGLFLLENQKYLNKGASDLKGLFLWDTFGPQIPYTFWYDLHNRIKRKGGYEHKDTKATR